MSIWGTGVGGEKTIGHKNHPSDRGYIFTIRMLNVETKAPDDRV